MPHHDKQLAQALHTLASAFGSAADLVARSIDTRPVYGLPNSPRAGDFADETLAERNLLTFGLQGSLGLLQSARGNARALSLVYSQAAPAYIDPAPFAMQRSIWETTHTCSWLLDGHSSSSTRVSRVKGWLGRGLHDQMKSPRRFDEETQKGILSSLDECSEPAVHPLDYVTMSKRSTPNGEDVYRTLSSLVHGQAWAVVPAFSISPHGDGHYIRWRAYPHALHVQMAAPVIRSMGVAVDTVYEYFTGTPDVFAEDFAALAHDVSASV